jgi:5-methylcytosine-specific restriction endonuclease McrA
MEHKLRKQCRCGGFTGRIETKNGQDCVYCLDCGRHQYNAPRVETGRTQRTVTTVHNGIKPKQRARIITRATGRCEMCGARNDIHVGHIISVDTGLKMGLTEVDLNDDENLAALCAECNLGIGKEPMPLRLAVGMLMSRVKLRLESGDVQGRGNTGDTEVATTLDYVATREPQRADDEAPF